MHIDMNSYFASCELRNEVDIFSKVLVVGHVNKQDRGIISAASYGARAKGIKAAMSIAEAKRIYPKLSVVPVNMNYYKELSNQVMNFFKSKFEIVEQASIDEAYIDITNILKTYDNELNLAKNLQKQVRNTFNLPCSIGIGDNKLQAKMSSNKIKPLGITIVNSQTFVEMYKDSHISKVHGIGKVSQEKFYHHNLNTIGDVLKLTKKEFIKLGFKEEHYNWCQGISKNEIEPNRYIINKSISHDKTYFVYLNTEEQILEETKKIYEEVYKRMTSKTYMCKSISVKIRYEDFSQKQNSFTMKNFTKDTNVIWNEVQRLLFDLYSYEKRVRLISVSLNNVIKESEYNKKYNRYFDLFAPFLKENNNEKD